MNDETGSPGILRRLLRWATTPPQAYVVYVLGLLVVWYVSFYAGTMNPRRTAGPGPAAAVSAPRN